MRRRRKILRIRLGITIILRKITTKCINKWILYNALQIILGSQLLDFNYNHISIHAISYNLNFNEKETGEQTEKIMPEFTHLQSCI